MSTLEYLQRNKVHFTTHEHPRTASARRLAKALCEKVSHVARAMVVKVDGEFVVVLVQALHRLNLERIRESLGARSAELASRLELRELFPDCEPGIVPPFGSQSGLRTVIDRSLCRQPHLFLDIRTKHEALRLQTCDFVRLEQPLVTDVA